MTGESSIEHEPIKVFAWIIIILIYRAVCKSPHNALALETRILLNHTLIPDVIPTYTCIALKHSRSAAPRPGPTAPSPTDRCTSTRRRRHCVRCQYTKAQA